jgi:hypothetical protein
VKTFFLGCVAVGITCAVFFADQQEWGWTAICLFGVAINLKNYCDLGE